MERLEEQLKEISLLIMLLQTLEEHQHACFNLSTVSSNKTILKRDILV